MKKTLLTVEISTQEALEEVLTEEIAVLYITAKLYLGLHSTIGQLMAAHGYARYQICRRGVLFVKTQGNCKFDPRRHRIALPPEET